MNSTAPHHVLIIDADNVRRGMLACTLPTTGYALDFAKTKEAGLDKLHHGIPDIILIGESAESADICEHIRSLPTAHACTLVLMREASQVHDDAPTSADNEALGADIVISFPFTRDDLEEAIAKHDNTAAATAPTMAAATTTPFEDEASSPTTEDEETTSETENEEEAWATFRQGVHDLHDNLAKLDYYAILGVSVDATAAQVKDAYFERSTAYHPDRFMQLDDADLRQQIYEIFKRATEAFKILLDPAARDSYDRQLAASETSDLRYHDPKRKLEPALGDDDLAQTPAGRRFAELAENAKNAGKLGSARLYFTLATQCEPRNDALRSRLAVVLRQLAH